MLLLSELSFFFFFEQNYARASASVRRTVRRPKPKSLDDATPNRVINENVLRKIAQCSRAPRDSHGYPADSFVKLYNNGTSRYFCKAARQFA